MTVDAGSSTTSCTDSFFDGAPEPQWSIQIESNEESIYPMNGACYNNTPNIQFEEVFFCAQSIPTELNICLRAFEDDGALAVCTSLPACLEEYCDSYTVPSSGSQTMDISVSGQSSADVTLTISLTGTFLPGDANDVICDAVHLGTLNSGSTLGDDQLSSYGNHCASSMADPDPWGGNNDQGVWFSFDTGEDPAAIVEIMATSDPAGVGDPIDLQLALYSSSDQTCSGTLTLVAEEYNGLGLSTNERLQLSCLEPLTTYFLLVDGESTTLINEGGVYGYFGLEIRDSGMRQAADLICEAEDLGVVPDGGSVSTPTLSRSNLCATVSGDPTPGTWAPQRAAWFQFTAPANGHVVITAVSDLTFPTGIDPIDLQLALWGSSTGACTGVLEEKGSSYVTGSNDETLEVTCLTPGEDYWVMVDGSAANEAGIFGLTISNGGMALPSNDDLCSAIHLGTVPNGGVLDDGADYSNFCNGTEVWESSTDSYTVNSTAWFSFNAPLTGGFNITAMNDPNGLGDAIDLQLAIYTSSDNSCTGVLTERASSYDTSQRDETLVRGGIQGGRLVYLQVDGAGSAPSEMEGWFTLSIEDDPVAASPLPIDLLYFSAEKRDLFVLLDWATASEVSNALFQIERLNGQHWEVIRELAGAGNSSTVQAYSTIDDRPYEGLNYYRLKQIDHDGTSTYSEVVSVDMAGDGLKRMEVYPNPVKDHLSVILNATYSKQAEIRLVDANGRDHYSTKITLVDGSGRWDIDLGSSLSPGTYVLHVLTERGEELVERVVVE